MSENILKSKSYSFAIKIVRLTQGLMTVEKEFVMSKHLIRSGTAIGALIREAEFAQSKKDFINKLSIALKEANETLYWIDLLKDTDYLETEKHGSMIKYCNELIAMLVSSIKTTKARL